MENVAFKKNNRVGIVSIQRPKMRNALNFKIFEELKTVFSNESNFSDVDVIIIQGYENNDISYFSSGIDLLELATLKPQELESKLEFMQNTINAIEKCRLPVIAKVTSFCFGSALELALAADFIIADEMCQFGMFETKFGIIPDLGGTTRLVNKIGVTNAKRVIYLADKFSAEEAKDLGIVTWTCTLEKINEETNKLVRQLQTNSIPAIVAAKNLINKIYNENLNRNLNYEKITQLQLIGSEEVKTRINNYLKH